MLDELLGRASLKERIDELADENERLRKRYEAEADRRAEATTAKQDAQERLNRLEDRIAQLEGELDRVEDEDSGPTLRQREQLRGDRLAAVLDRLLSVRTDAEGALTVPVADRVPGAVRDDLRDVLGDRIALVEESPPCLCCVDDAGLISVTLDPPLEPDCEPGWDDRFDLDRAWFLPTGRYTLALVRADLFALGVYQGGERLHEEGFESDVKGSHSKGGFSQARFERIRDGQIDAHLDRCREALADRAPDRLIVAGQRGVIETLIQEADLDPVATAAVDATGTPIDALDDAHHVFWTTELRVV